MRHIGKDSANDMIHSAILLDYGILMKVYWRRKERLQAMNLPACAGIDLGLGEDEMATREASYDGRSTGDMRRYGIR